MTDNEIIRVLTQYAGTYANYGVKKVAQEALSLINRQKAEIEMWRKNCDELYDQMTERLKEELKIERRLAKAEAIKAFVERLEKDFAEGVFGASTVRYMIDNLVKEMVGDDNAE